jgi:hypothetical protein
MIRNLLQHHIEEVKDVRQVDEDDPFAKGFVKASAMDASICRVCTAFFKKFCPKNKKTNSYLLQETILIN